MIRLARLGRVFGFAIKRKPKKSISLKLRLHFGFYHCVEPGSGVLDPWKQSFLKVSLETTPCRCPPNDNRPLLECRWRENSLFCNPYFHFLSPPSEPIGSSWVPHESPAPSHFFLLYLESPNDVRATQSLQATRATSLPLSATIRLSRSVKRKGALDYGSRRRFKWVDVYASSTSFDIDSVHQRTSSI